MATLLLVIAGIKTSFEIADEAETRIVDYLTSSNTYGLKPITEANTSDGHPVGSVERASSEEAVSNFGEAILRDLLRAVQDAERQTAAAAASAAITPITVHDMAIDAKEASAAITKR